MHSIFLSIAGLLLPAVARAESIVPFDPLKSTTGGPMEGQPGMPGKDLGIRWFEWNTVYGYVYKLLGVALGLVGVVLFAMYVYAGALWLTSLGDTGQIGKAKKLLTEATVGLVIIMLSYVIVRALMSLRGL